MKDLTDQEIALLSEMINKGQFSGEGVETVFSLKQKVQAEIKKRMNAIDKNNRE